jgi:prolyl oligopeptidase
MVVAQRSYVARDGTRIPLYLVARRDVLARGKAPTLLYGYGGFAQALTPGFVPARLAWVANGGIFAMANIRGGGEFGASWHDAGRREHKQNSFNDFIDAAEFLAGSGLTTPQQLAIAGRSNGGLLVAAAVNQRPDLFGAALPSVGVMDMLRFDRFTAGRYWIDDYGDPSVERDFRTLLGYSPYHNVRSGRAYPAILVSTGDSDDRVVPAHSFKYAAALQAADIGANPRLLRVENGSGHGGGRPVDRAMAEWVDQMAFAAHQVGMQAK